jgi:ketosteroid isomerase-like protein
MSEPSEVVRETFDALREWDIARVLDMLDPDVELDTTPWLPDGTVYRKHHGILRYLEEISKLWGRPFLDVEDLFDLGGGQVLAAGHTHGSHASSGVVVIGPAAWLCEVDNGVVLRIRVYERREEAVAAAGEASRARLRRRTGNGV